MLSQPTDSVLHVLKYSNNICRNNIRKMPSLIFVELLVNKWLFARMSNTVDFLDSSIKPKMSLGTKYMKTLVKIQFQGRKHLTTRPWPLGEPLNENRTSACWLSSVDPLCTCIKDKF